MKHFIKTLSFMFTIIFVINIFPVSHVDAAEKKYSLRLTGEYELAEYLSAGYSYDEAMEGIKLEKVAGKNKWNLTMYAGTKVYLKTDKKFDIYQVKCSFDTKYAYAFFLQMNPDYVRQDPFFCIDALDNGQTKSIKNKVITFESYNEQEKRKSTLKIVLTILPNPHAERKSKLELTGEYDLGDKEKVIYQYNKMMKNIKLDKVKGKNKWNLTMYEGTEVKLPYIAPTGTDAIEITETFDSPYYISGEKHYEKDNSFIHINIWNKLKEVVLTCKALDESGKCLRTLEIVVTVLPYSAKLERTKLITAKELYKLNYKREYYTDFVWEYVIKKYPEVLVEDDVPLMYLHGQVVRLMHYGYAVPQYLFDQFGGKDADELDDIIGNAKMCDVLNYDEEIIDEARIAAVADGVDKESLKLLDDVIQALKLEEYDTDLEKVSIIQEWVSKNIRYEPDYFGAIGAGLDVVRIIRSGTGAAGQYLWLVPQICCRIGIPCYGQNILMDGIWCERNTFSGDFDVSDTDSIFLSVLQQIFGGEIYSSDEEIGLFFNFTTGYWYWGEEDWEELEELEEFDS